MRDLRLLEAYREVHPDLGTSEGEALYGYFVIFGLRILASTGGGWDHVSVSHPDRIPSWAEMCAMRDMFFREEEVVMQLHPRKQDEINACETCLHLWRPQSAEVPLPPKWMVGPQERPTDAARKP